MNNIEATILVDLFLGDNGKGKIAHHLAKLGQFNYFFRFNGGENSGRTIYIDGKKYISHLFPTGIVCGIKSIIGCGCVLNEKSFFRELEEVSKIIPNASELIKIAYNTHIVQDKHIEEELNEIKIGTTRKGIGPAYRDKYARTGIRAEQVSSLKPFLIDVYEEFYSGHQKINVLCEGVQGMGLDIDYCIDYPYCTSSHCGVGSVVNNGIPHTSIKSVEGVIKPYATYVGAKQFQDPDDSMLDKICELGSEYGSTTARKRKINYLDIDLIKKFANMTSSNVLHVNKMDILRELNCWKMFVNNKLINVGSEELFKEMLETHVGVKDIRYYYSAE